MADEKNGTPEEPVGLPSLDVDTFKIPTQPCEATLWLADGRQEEVTIFLSPQSQMHSGGETVGEFLESDRLFLPVRIGNDNHLISRGAILRLDVATDAPTFLQRDETTGSPLELVSVELEGGQTVEGTLRLFGPAQSRRVSDAFNDPHAFVPLETKGGVVFINKHRVLRVSF